MGGHPTTLYFLEEHAKMAVLHAFLEASPILVEEKPGRYSTV